MNITIRHVYLFDHLLTRACSLPETPRELVIAAIIFLLLNHIVKAVENDAWTYDCVVVVQVALDASLEFSIS